MREWEEVNWVKRLMRLLNPLPKKKLVKMQFEHAKAESRLDMAMERLDAVVAATPKKAKNDT